MNKAYMIVGASSGIGEACVRKLADKNNTLVLVSRNYDKLIQLAEELPGTVIPFQYDLQNLDNIKDIFEFCKDNEIKLDGLVYSAGINADCPIKVNNIALMQESMTVNCFAFLEMGKYFYNKRYSNEGASVVAISSIASLTCEKGMAPYSASKAALNAVVKTMSKEFTRRKMRVNAILPGGVDTPMSTKKNNIMKSVNTAKEVCIDNMQELGLIPSNIIAEHVWILLSDISRYTTGELMTIGGGQSY